MKRLSQVLGISPSYAARLEQSSVRTVFNLAQVESLQELSLHAQIPVEWLQRWQLLARQRVAATNYRRRVGLVLGGIAALVIGSVLGIFLGRSRQLAVI